MERGTAYRRVVILLFFALAIVSRSLVFESEAYLAFYRAQPEWLRWLEQPLRWITICLAGLLVAERIKPRAAPAALGLVAPVGKGMTFAFVATLPMLVAGLALGDFEPSAPLVEIAFSAAVWPFAEEVLYRGYAFGRLHLGTGMGLWPAAMVTGVFFGVVHLGQASVQDLPLVGEIGTVALIAVGGILFAWLYARWRGNLWVPFFLHGTMNLWWSVFDLAENPLGGWLPNVARAITVLLAIGLTLQRERIPWLATPRAEQEEAQR